MKPASVFVGALVAALAPPAAAVTCSRTSPAHSIALVELYTSEGCSSCPPADRWLAKLAASRAIENRVVAIGLHVDYWDRLGWRDVYAKPVFTDRQRVLSKMSGVSYVYTPQVALQGRDFRQWQGLDLARRLEAINRTPARAQIDLGIDATAPGTIKLSARGGTTVKGAQLYAALVQDRITSKVTAGENRGETLAHAAVVRDWLGPATVDAGGTASLSVQVAVPKGARSSDLRLAAFVQDPVGGDILQALDLPVCPAP